MPQFIVKNTNIYIQKKIFLTYVLNGEVASCRRDAALLRESDRDTSANIRVNNEGRGRQAVYTADLLTARW